MSGKPQDTARRPRFDSIDALTAWMIDGARPSADAREIITGICEGLLGLGVRIALPGAPVVRIDGAFGIGGGSAISIGIVPPWPR